MRMVYDVMLALTISAFITSMFLIMSELSKIIERNKIIKKIKEKKERKKKMIQQLKKEHIKTYNKSKKEKDVLSNV